VTTGTPVQPLRRTLATTLAAATVSALPVLLLGGLALLVRADLHFGELGLGIAIGAFFTASALVSLPAGAVSDRVGPAQSMALGLVLTAATLVGVAVLPTSLGGLLPWLVVGGIANAFIQVGANHLLAVDVPLRQQGIAYGVKQSAVPLAAVLAGLSVPVIGLTVGWRAAYAGGALVGLVVLWTIWRGVRGQEREDTTAERSADAPRLALAVLALGAGFGTTAANALAGFSVSSSVDAGMAQDVAGLLLTAGSLLGMASRITSGWIADRIGWGSLLLAAGLLAIGTVGYAGMAARPPAIALVPMTLLAFTGGWGYQGLILLAVARTNPGAPASAMAIVRIGPNTGAVVGPLAFGALVEAAGYQAAWAFAAGASLAAVILVLLGRVMLVPVRERIAAARDAETGSG